MEPSTWIALSSVFLTLLATLLAYRSSRNANTVNQDANNIQWVRQAREAAASAEAKSEEAERRADALLYRMRIMEQRMVTIESKMRYLVALIHDPHMTLALLRERIPSTFANPEDGDEGGR